MNYSLAKFFGFSTVALFSGRILLLAFCSHVSVPFAFAQSQNERRLAHEDVPTEDKSLVVMIHGWGGDPKDTWLAFPDILFKSLPKYCDVVTVGYPSGFQVASAPLQTLSKFLADWLRRRTGKGNNADYKEYIFIAHSYGGLVVKNYLVEELSLGRKVKTRLVFLIGTPNMGDDFSKLASHLPFIPKEQLTQLRDTEFLYDLHLRYMVHTGLLNMDDVSPAVIQRVKTVAIFGKSTPDGDGVVNIVSARSLFPGSRVVFKNHVSLVKPSDETDEVFAIVRDEIVQVFAPKRLGPSVIVTADRGRAGSGN
jgi:pimeloyl-ACP methyl ester carboxylesterase